MSRDGSGQSSYYRSILATTMARPDSPALATKSHALDESEYDETIDDADNPLVRALSGLPLSDSEVLKHAPRTGPDGGRST